MGAGLSPHAAAAALAEVRPLCTRVLYTCTRTPPPCPSSPCRAAPGIWGEIRLWPASSGVSRLPRGGGAGLGDGEEREGIPRGPRRALESMLSKGKGCRLEKQRSQRLRAESEVLRPVDIHSTDIGPSFREPLTLMRGQTYCEILWRRAHRENCSEPGFFKEKRFSRLSGGRGAEAGSAWCLLGGRAPLAV